MNNKKFEFVSEFSVTKAAEGEDDTLRITGYANTTKKDRVNDVIPESAWDASSLKNYKKNPIVLAFHDHKKPIGITETLEVDSGGLKITARISKAASDVYELIKDGILRAFSISLIIKDADYDSATDIFVIKQLELLEISVVSVPMNQDSLFSLAKSFENEEKYLEFKKSFNKEIQSEDIESEEATEKDANLDQMSNDKSQGNIMDPKELQALLDSAAEKAAEKAASLAIETGKTGAERLLAEVEKRFKDKEDVTLKEVEDLRASLKEKAAEIEALNKSKMEFKDREAEGKVSIKDKTAAVLMSKITNKKIEDTDIFKNIVQKGGSYVPAASSSLVWELEVSTNLEDEIRRALIVAPVFNKVVPMNNPVMRIPVNPEAGYATWVLEAAYKAATSSGSEVAHLLKEINLTTYKLASKNFIGSEEEEDSILPLIPIIRDAMIRRQAKAWDKALLRGAGSGGDPIKGIATTAAAGETVSVAATGSSDVADMIAMRQKLGTRGLNPSELVYIVSSEVYYDLLNDPTFQTVDKIGDRATLLTGQVGSIGNSPVLVSGEFEAKAATKVGAVIVQPMNFLVGNYKGLKVESDYLVEAQQRILVATQRVAFQQISTVEGNGVAKLAWT